ncbi:hypothetical protein EDWATA_02613 [Edwardsiella tarda ATCC 23685]|uniref:Uncharacterized protein n=1 Tax=Edwardsiella tarda ATCC 23685 TaxID=500638 RepID=D4F779_EDWTA|nr:hypothetical protein EDWATA_02613 [Edwardsiella tarda ATCC 23685]
MFTLRPLYFMLICIELIVTNAITITMVIFPAKAGAALPAWSYFSWLTLLALLSVRPWHYPYAT